MSLGTTLLPLNCLNCRTPVPAEPGEVGWVCSRCGSGVQLAEDDALAPLNLRYSADIRAGGTGRPFWVVDVSVDVEIRATLPGTEAPPGPQPWAKVRTFFIPAFVCGLEDALKLAAASLYRKPALKEGPSTPLAPIVLKKEEIRAYIEFVIISVEAEREDKLTRLEFEIQMGEPELWVLP